MEPVIDLKHFSALIKQTRAASGTLISNSFLLPVHIQQYTQQKKLFVVSLQDGICFLIDTGDFYRLDFYLAGKTRIEFSRKDKPVVINLVHRETHRSDALQQMEDQWVESGFRRYKSFKRMSLHAGNGDIFMPENLPAENTSYTPFFMEDAWPVQNTQLDELIKLWRNTLDIYSNALPSTKEMQKLVSAQQILCIQDHDRHIIGALHFQTENKVCTIQHVAVEENHRRLGLARAMVNFCFSHSTDVQQYVLWVEEKNLPAIHLYSSLSFKFDGLFSNQLILF